jgi:hypothetical protein
VLRFRQSPQLPMQIDFWYQAHQNDMEEKKKQWEKPGEK